VAGNIEADGNIYGATLHGDAAAETHSNLNENRVTKSGVSGVLTDSQIYDNGTNVGIGVTAPTAKLDVDGTIYAKGDLTVDGGIYGHNRIQVDAGIYARDITINGGTLVSAFTTDDTLAANSNNNVPTERAVRGYVDGLVGGSYVPYTGASATINLNGQMLVNTGNVGIATTTPRARLEVVGAGAGTGTAFQIDDNLYNPKVTVLDNGNVGIGTTSPGYPLEVRLGATQQMFLNTAGLLQTVTLRATNIGSYFNTGGSLNYANAALATFGGGAVIPLAVKAGAAQTGNLTEWSSSTGALMAVVDKNGNVGIGTSVPAVKLNVFGGAAHIQADNTAVVNYAAGPGDLYVHNNLEVDGNVYLGDAIADNLIVAGNLTLSGNTNYTGPVTITTTNASALLVEDQSGVDIFNVNTQTGHVRVDATIYAGGDVTLGLASALYTSTNQDLFVAGNIQVDGNIYGATLHGDAAVETHSNLNENKVTKSGASGVLTDSQIYDNGTNVGIGTTVPTAKLDVDGTVYAKGDLTVDGGIYGHNRLQVDAGIYARDITINGGTLVTAFTTDNTLLANSDNNVPTERAVKGYVDNIVSVGYVPYSGATGTIDLNNKMLVNVANVGVGVVTPMAELDVDGEIYGRADVTVGTPVKTYITPDADLFVQGSIETDANIYGVNGTLSGALAVTQTSTLTGEVTTGADVTVGTATKNFITGSPDLFVQGTIETDANIYAAGDIHIDGDIYGNDSQLTGSLTVDGGIYGHGRMQVDGDVYGTNAAMTGNMNVVGRSSVGSTAGAQYATGAGDLYVQNNLEVDGNVYLGDLVTDNIMVTGLLTLSGETNYAGPVTITTTHAGALLVQKEDGTDIFNVDTQTSHVTVDGTIYAGGDVTLGAVTPTYTTGNTDLFVQGSIETDANVYAVNVQVSSLTQDRMTKAGANGVLVDSQVYEVGGNIGIGVAAPTAKLDVDGTIYAFGDVTLGAASTTYASTETDLFVKGNIEFDGRIYGDGSQLTGLTAANPTPNVVPKSDGTVLLDSVIYDVGGNIGIGVPAPTAKLDVDGTIYVGGDVTLGLASALYTSASQDLFVVGNIEADGNIYGATLHGDAAAETHSNLNENRVTKSGVSGILTDSQIYDNGTNVGIGTTIPTAKLDVDGTIYAAGDVTLGAASTTYASAETDLFVKGNIEFDGMIYGDGTGLTGISVANPTVNALPKSTGTNFVDSMIYDVSGNIGIGTLTPTVKLEVDGTIYARENIYAAGNVGIGTAIVDSARTPRILITASEMQINLQ
jgi:cytoskeletal protein CcmA (bactofilin family)